MHTGSMMPPRDGNESDEELLAKVIPLRRREDTAHDPGCSTLRPLGAEAEPREPEKLGPPDRSTLTLEHSIWDPLTLELPRRPTAAQRRLRRVLDARVLHWHGPARRGNRHSSDGRHRCHRARARAQRLRAQRLPPAGRLDPARECYRRLPRQGLEGALDDGAALCNDHRRSSPSRRWGAASACELQPRFRCCPVDACLDW